ncbi:MAG: 2-succinyl-5-enolpyruvyl-6-hydroxy-3-cyclohexene-carboxylic-acid synthase [Pseudomonadota bacterium]
MTSVVLLHGAYGSPDDWAPALEWAGVAAICPALDATLAAAELEDLHVDDIAPRLVDRLEATLPPGALVLGGYSLGARLALALAARPSVAARLAGLLLVSGTAGLEAPKERAARAALDDERAAALRNDPAGFLKTFWSLPLFAGLAHHPLRERLLARRIEQASRDPAGLARLMRGLSVGRMPPLWDELADLQAGTVVLCGAQDVDYVRLGRRLAETLPDARLRVVEGSGHALLLEAPEAVGRELRALMPAGTMPRNR